MPSCLGLYIEDNLIKYAKVSKNSDELKVEAFGVKFYDKLGTAIKQIVEETYSFKLPISINSTDEWYNEIRVFSLLSKSDINNAVKTEFENICYIKELNQNIYEQRYIFTNSNSGDEKIKIIHVSVPKTSIEHKKNQFSEYKINNISPIGITIANLLNKENKGTALVVNIEKDTTITKIKDGFVADVKVINNGSQEILEKINQKENSYAKAYEICKNTTIYTDTDKDLQYEENEYLEDIMPTIFQIVSQVKKVVDESFENIEKVYITGTGALINNIDIYFQDYLRQIQCEILKPSFISKNSKISIKDYMEVNSAISIGLQGLDKNNKGINFKSESGKEKVWELLNSNMSEVKHSDAAKTVNNFFARFRRQFETVSVTFLMLVVLYVSGVFLINNQIENKIAEAKASIQDTNTKIYQIQAYNMRFDAQISKYKNLINSIENLNNANSENKRFRNAIPNLLNNIMAVIPRGVQLISITNTVDTHIIITAKTNSYEEIAYFKAKLKTEGILENVVSDTGILENNYLNVTIEGELPWEIRWHYW